MNYKKSKTLMKIFIYFIFCFYSILAHSNEMDAAIEFFKKNDYAKVIEIIRPAVERKDPRALSQMGSFYEKGLGVPKDLHQAFKFYKEAADLGYGTAQFNLGLMYQYGRHVKSDVEKAIFWYKKSVDNDDPEGDAAYNLGVLYTRDSRVKRNITLGMKYYEMAFSKGNAMAAYNLGVIHSDGDYGFPVNKKIAVFYYTISSLKDYPDALHNLSVMYQNGDGVLQNFEESIRYNIRAIKRNVPASMLALGSKYILGIGVPSNLKLSYMWALLSKNAGAENSEILLKVSSDRLTQREITEMQNLARQCLQSAYENCQYPRFALQPQ